MARTLSVSLDDEFTGYIEEAVTAGRYGSAADVIRAGLRLLQDAEVRHARLVAEIDAGEASGVAVDWTLDTFLRDVRAERGL